MKPQIYMRQVSKSVYHLYETPKQIRQYCAIYSGSLADCKAYADSIGANLVKLNF